MSYAREKQFAVRGGARYLEPAAIDLPDEPSQALAIGDPQGRDHAARDCKQHLKVGLGWKRRR